MNLRAQLEAYVPCCEQEERDRALMLDCLSEEDIFLRRNLRSHMTASAWIVNHDRTKVLMAYHNIYQSWAWLGGHADGERDLLSVALREAREESGVLHIKPVSEEVFSVEVLTVDGHVKRGQYVPSHLHLNVTYLLEADEGDRLSAKMDENSGVRWFALEEALDACSEAWMRKYVYEKLNRKLQAL